MNFKETPIQGLFIVEPKIRTDSRGHFFESYNEKLFKDAGIAVNFVQDNQSLSHRGTLRGLHAQTQPYAQGKLVRVITGKVLDVVVDIRKTSLTYGQYFTLELSEENKLMFWVPPGFLHGFATLEDNTIFTYKVTKLYDRESEIGVMWNDEDLNIDWKIPQQEIILSDKDKVLKNFKDLDSPF